MTDRPPPVLDVKGMVIRFGGLTAVSDVSLQVRDREIVGLIGPNGAGKSTFVNGVTGLHRLAAGSVWLRGRCIDQLPPEGIAQAGVARTFQNLRLFRSMTVLDNVMSGFHTSTRAGFLGAVLKTRRQRQEEARIREEALGLLKRFGLDTRRDEVVANLPYAQQKGVELCRALALRPSLLLLDEPTGGMSLDERSRLREMIAGLAEMSMGVLLIEHDVNLVMATCHRVVVLDHGQKIAEGTPEEVRGDRGVIAAYLGEEE